MNRREYNSDPRYAKVLEQMDLLGIMDITTTRQAKNGTIVWKLPIKNEWPGNQKNATFIQVASFSTGYVRNQNSGYSNYQLNKRCESEPQYYPIYEWCDEANMSVKTDKFRQFTTRTCKLIPIEIDNKLNQWIYNSIIRAEIKELIVKECSKQYNLGIEAGLDHKINTNN